MMMMMMNRHCKTELRKRGGESAPCASGDARLRSNRCTAISRPPPRPPAEFCLAGFRTWSLTEEGETARNLILSF